MPTFRSRALAASAAVAVSFAAFTGAAFAQKKYDTGASDTEIKIGNIMPYSGPASAYGTIGKTEEAYFRMINEQGGINGRKINFISYDDAYSPPKAVEQARKLVESDEVLAVFNPLGTPSNTAIQKYLNAKKVPQLFVATGASKWNDPKTFPWTIGWQPSYQSEAKIYVKYILKEKPNAKVAILYQNDDFGKDYLKGTLDGFGDKAKSMVIAEEPYEISEPTIDSHIVKLKALNPDVLLIYTTPKFAAQTIRKTAELGWKPLQILTNVSASVGSVMQPAGFDNAQGVLSANYAKDATDEQWRNDPKFKNWHAFVDKYMPGTSKSDSNMVYGYGAASTLVEVLKRCGDDLTRANVMKQAASLKDFEPDTLLPGIKINTSPTDFAPISQLQMMRFKGDRWELFGDIISADAATN
ncbi:amino acid/amide ABC transporter substrate-binding protein (HAAT family) [Rhodopseudomonas thermotolerans]|jgi:branched-chain amino acid transport system substrate-binding protein|uniref:Amino acid/amide ABC transporter substrate-binding protein (HAAT family) n=2 Tax=Rhodopseudomonas TaxID=1073 RepID=A0A336JYH2_9BRAD|nr:MULTISPECIES: ABC transporter substrate-binding protein [Rhodopseudomonas]RED22978.1 amino acid/amide ABC transporter substrate-binding protein (HAAT family) [Rhodopseudomonas pentothenatexigens]REF89699.1 amino acid/amide ABC transporter substrate-binding protein (HAAT family) [Rhodopseudomonas thermotolerans]SSW93426.1 amino acid/amide ABC transporter substrate-binding protein (HAAT family) [Rhodopseudomonas pentothenatexigens]